MSMPVVVVRSHERSPTRTDDDQTFIAQHSESMPGRVARYPVLLHERGDRWYGHAWPQLSRLDARTDYGRNLQVGRYVRSVIDAHVIKVTRPGQAKIRLTRSGHDLIGPDTLR